MLITLTKLADIAARSLFVLLVLYALPVRSTGQFGLALTLVGFFTFAAGFERYADLQRRMVTLSAEQTERLIVSSLGFWATNHLVGMPVLLGLLLWWVKLPPALVVVFGLIAVVEHLSNEVYRISLIVTRHRALLLAVLAKNLLTLAAVGGLLWLQADQFTLEAVIWIWAATSLLGLLAVGLGFTRTWVFTSLAAAGGAGLRQIGQYQASRTHFMIGLVAVAALQVDRLLAGALLTLEQTGLYFRHIFLASFAYQVFNVASYNRVAPRVYNQAQSGRPAQARATLRREYRLIALMAVLLTAAIWLISRSRLGQTRVAEGIDPYFLSVLVLGYLLRAGADFNAMLLNAVFEEHGVFTSQTVALLVTIAANIALTSSFGMAGTVTSLVVGSACYLLLSALRVRHSTPLNIAKAG